MEAKLPHLERIKPLAQDWAVNGFGTPTVIYLLYAVKLVLFVFAALLVISASTPGIGGLGDIGDWWTEPIVFQKIVVWMMLWELHRARLGLDAADLPLLAADRRRSSTGCGPGRCGCRRCRTRCR